MGREELTVISLAGKLRDTILASDPKETVFAGRRPKRRRWFEFETLPRYFAFSSFKLNRRK
jgi:hypothetical protein